MRLGMIFLTSVLSASLVTGCATVNLSEMRTPAAAKAAKTEFAPEKNIVLRAASKLYNMITDKGFTAKASGERVQSAASILLNGLEERELTSANVSYAERGLAVTVVEADIRYTTQHISQTNKAAEVFLEIAESDRSMREELESLETALLASREASDVFSSIVASDNTNLISLKNELAALTRITDQFGERVRLHAATEMVSRRVEEGS